MIDGELLEKAYRIAEWIDDPRRGRSVKRYREALERSKYLFNHPWFKELLRGRRVYRC